MCNRANPTQLGFMNNYQSCFLVTGDVFDMMGTRLSAKCRQEIKQVSVSLPKKYMCFKNLRILHRARNYYCFNRFVVESEEHFELSEEEASS